MSDIAKWLGECARKKKLRSQWASNIIQRAAKEGTKLFRYYCSHCQHWHVTKSEYHTNKFGVRVKNESQ